MEVVSATQQSKFHCFILNRISQRVIRSIGAHVKSACSQAFERLTSFICDFTFHGVFFTLPNVEDLKFLEFGSLFYYVRYFLTYLPLSK